MNTHFEILIDASGSMGYMTGTENENKSLLPDGSTRTDLVKKILNKSLIPKMSFVNSLGICTFSSKVLLDNRGKVKLMANRKQYYPDVDDIYLGSYKLENIYSAINKIDNPNEGGTPLSWALGYKLHNFANDQINIIVLSDGGSSDDTNFDDTVLKIIQEINKPCKIYFIGIAQNEKAKLKSKNLSDKTKGFYINLKVINYDEAVFDNMLFEFNTTLTSNALKESLKTPILTAENKILEKVEIENKPEIFESLIKEYIIEKEVSPTDIKMQVAENTKSLQLISSQLDTIVKQISFIGTKKPNTEDEFEDNDNEDCNKLIGYQSEEIVFKYLKSKWEKITWTNEYEEQYNPFDFQVEIEGKTFYIECKGTVSTSKEFFLTKKEWSFYLANRKNYRLYFVSDINGIAPSIYRIEDLLTDMEEGKLIPCSGINRKVKADRILFQILE